MYGVQKPPIYDSNDSFGMQKWFQRVWNYILSRVGIKTATSTYTVEPTIFYVRADATSGAFSVILPPAVDWEGRQIVIKKIDSSINTITIDPNASETLDGALTVILSDKWDSRQFISNGSNWEILSQGVDADLTNTIASTYTPTLTNVTNLSASTAYVAQYARVGNVVTVSGKFDATATTATAVTQLGISLPIASNLANNQECSGTFYASAVASGGAINGDTVNDRAQANWIAGDTSSRAFHFIFMYRII